MENQPCDGKRTDIHSNLRKAFLLIPPMQLCRIVKTKTIFAPINKVTDYLRRSEKHYTDRKRPPAQWTSWAWGCSGCIVAVFENSNADGEGETYLGSTTASASGVFTLTVAALSERFLTATATDPALGTSEFSRVFDTNPTLYLPIVLK